MDVSFFTMPSRKYKRSRGGSKLIRFRHKRVSRSRRKGASARTQVRKSRYRGGNRRGKVDPRAGGKLVRLIKRIAGNQIETQKYLAYDYKHDGYANGGWGEAAQGPWGYPAPYVVEVHLREVPRLAFGAIDTDGATIRGDKVTIVGIKVNIKVMNNFNDEVNYSNEQFRVFWMRAGVDDRLTGNNINEMVVAPLPPYGYGNLTGWSKGASITNNLASHFMYKEKSEWIKRWDTGWFVYPIIRAPNSQDKVQESNMGTTLYADSTGTGQPLPTATVRMEPQRQYKPLSFDRYLKVNTEYTAKLEGVTYDIEGFVPQFICFLYTGENATAPLIEVTMDLYFKDA